ncbi:hypothetical protein CYK67_07215 [Clostridium perfringens]|nr:hypothetical protein CYK67_07215 [Clostridium perfringens]
MFADLSQLKGRGQRGGASCIIHLIDTKFYPQTAEFVKLTGKSNIGRVIEKKMFLIMENIESLTIQIVYSINL